MSIKATRLLAGLIDHTIIVFLISIIDSFFYSKVDTEAIFFSIFIRESIEYFILCTCKDLIFKNASIGKRVFGLIVIKEDDRYSLQVRDLLIRNVLLLPLLAIEILLIIIDNKRIGDVISKTKVVQKLQEDNM